MCYHRKPARLSCDAQFSRRLMTGPAAWLAISAIPEALLWRSEARMPVSVTSSKPPLSLAIAARGLHLLPLQTRLATCVYSWACSQKRNLCGHRLAHRQTLERREASVGWCLSRQLVGLGLTPGRPAGLAALSSWSSRGPSAASSTSDGPPGRQPQSCCSHRRPRSSHE